MSLVCAVRGHNIQYIAALQVRQCVRPSCGQQFPSPQRPTPAPSRPIQKGNNQ